MTHLHTIEARGIRMTLDLRVGHVRALEIERQGRTIKPLHSAPWLNDGAVADDESLPGNLRCLSGDFFCAPFGLNDVEPAPSHGWPANSPWTLIETIADAGGVTARYALEKPVFGARVIKEMTLRDDHPFLYERHVFIGGAGALSATNHAMTRFSSAGGILAFSPKAYAETPAKPLEPDPARGRFGLAYPARFEDFLQAPLAGGGTASLLRYPFAEKHEDFVMLVEAPGRSLGWAAAMRPDIGDMFVSLKHPKTLPVTLLWFSNGGRDYWPWLGRHTGVLGIEEARAFSAYGHKASIEPNALSRSGVPTAFVLKPNGAVSVETVIGGLPIPEGFGVVADMVARDGCLQITDGDGQDISVPFDEDALAVR